MSKDENKRRFLKAIFGDKFVEDMMNMDIPGNMMDIPNNVLNSIIPGHHHVDFPQDGDPNFTKTVTIEGPKGNKIKVEKWVSKDGSKTFQRITTIDHDNPSITKTYKRKKAKKNFGHVKGRT